MTKYIKKTFDDENIDRLVFVDTVSKIESLWDSWSFK